jgi:integrase
MGLDVDWSDPLLERWLGGITRESTKKVYKSAFRLYTAYTGMTPSQLVDEALEDAKRDPRERRDVVKQRLIGFYNWLRGEAPKRRPGSQQAVGRGLSSKIAHTYVNAIRSFYATFDVYVKLKGRSGLPKPRVENRRMRLTNMDVKRLLDHCGSPRDRAIILTMFQSGMDVSTLCNLKYEDVAEGLARNEHPLRLNLYRQKSGTEYYTFLGRDAVQTLKAYLNSLKARGIQLKPSDPLFLKESYKAKKVEGITPDLVQKLMREVAFKAGFVDRTLNGKAFNPLSPHALRESFGGIMTGQGVPKTIVDFWLGHEIGGMAEAYQEAQYEDVRRMYLEREAHISVSVGEDLTRIREIEEQERRLQALVNGLTSENLELKARLAQLENEHREFKQQTLREIAELKQLIQQLMQTTG